LIKEEIAHSALWVEINVINSIAIAEEIKATVTAGVLSGVALIVRDPDAQAIVLKEPCSVVLAIVSWNALLILGLRAVAAAVTVAAGNTVVLKVGSTFAVPMYAQIWPLTHRRVPRFIPGPYARAEMFLEYSC
jgi:acyl-CoA reductase-like NAD-dependent aldehyde dehydrogenase